MSAPPQHVSVREFARLDGCDDKLVRRAIKAGKLRVSVEGKVDPTQAGTGWRKRNRHPAAGADTGADKAPSVRTNVRTRKVSAPAAEPTAHDVEQAEATIFAEDAENFLANVLAGQYADTATAERVKENALAAKHLLAARRDAGSLVEIEHAETVLFETQRVQRDAWLNFPVKTGPLIAAALGVEADKVVEALTAHVHQQIADLGDPDADFTGERQT